ncbi:hypothetical protein FHX08_003417 [Rhizobium sp. BK529]|nr:hypothetical protein [Rhizobium sp. BK529]TCS07454.1 hypothetical protein EV281_1021073 [Rhizobium sp. BK418]
MPYHPKPCPQGSDDDTVKVGALVDGVTNDAGTGPSTAGASAILASSGFHLELVQGANMLSNTSGIGGNSHVSDVAEDTSEH